MIVRKVMLLALMLSVVVLNSRSIAQPAVTELARTTFTPTNDVVLTWRLSFDEPVNGVTPANFTLDAAGVTANVTAVSALPGNRSWTVTASPVDGNGTLGLNLSNPSGVTGVSGPLSQTYTGEVYAVDQTDPSVVAITRTDPSPTNLSVVGFQIQFSEPVFGLSASNFAPGGAPAGTVINVVPSGDQSVWTAQISNISGSGRLSLDLTDTAGVTDAAGNYLASDYTSGEQYEIPPQLLCITRLDSNPTSATSVRYGIQFNVPVSGLTAGNFNVSGPGGTITDVTVVPEPVPATPPATDWTVTVGSISGDGLVQIAMQNPSIIVDSSGVSAISVTAPASCNEAIYTIDQSAPAAGCLVPDPPIDGTPTSATAVSYTFSFSEPVSGVSLTNFQVTTSDLTTYTVSQPFSSDGGSSYTITVTGIVEDPTNTDPGRFEITWLNTNGIVDEGGNSPAMPSGCGATEYVFDQTGPRLECATRYPAATDAVTSASVVSFLVTFDEPVTSSTVSADDFRIIAQPGSAFLSADVTSVTAVTPPPAVTSSQFIVSVANITGNASLVPPFLYNGNNSIGNGYLTVALSPTADILDATGNGVINPTPLATSCGETSYTIDQVKPFVTNIDFATSDCLTSAVFTVTFSEQVSDLHTTEVNVLWTGGTCKGPIEVARIQRVDVRTFTVEMTGTYPLFHQNGPGNIALEVRQDAKIHDVAYNPLNARFVSDYNYVCRCFEPAVVVAPKSLTTSIEHPILPLLTADGPNTATCTSSGLLTAPFNDTPTTITAPDSIRWKSTEWDCNTSSPFYVYLDDVLLSATRGNRTDDTPSTYTPNTTNSLCYPIGNDFSIKFPAPLEPGLHSLMVDNSGACTSGTTFYFNVLDAPVLSFPQSRFSACNNPRVFSWEPVDGALGYEVFYKEQSTTYSVLVERVTSPTTHLELPDLALPAGTYEWYVQAYNNWGFQPSEVGVFHVLSMEPFPANVLSTNGTVYDIHVTSSTTYVAGEFTLINAGGINYSRSNLAAIDNLTSKPTAWEPLVNGAVYTLEPAGNDLYIGGNFTFVNSAPRSKIARFVPDTSATLGTKFLLHPGFMPGADGPVRTIEVVGQKVYYGGEFTRIGLQTYNFGNFNDQIPAVRLAVASTTMTAERTPPPMAFSLEPNATVYDLHYDGQHMYIAGAFSSIGGRSIRGLARTGADPLAAMDPNFNLDLPSGVSHYVYTVLKVADELFIGGSFNSVLGQPRANAASLVVDGVTTPTLTPWNPRAQGAVHALETTGTRHIIYMGGTFTTLRQKRAAYLAGVDPVAGYVLTCEFNSDRAIYAIGATEQASTPPVTAIYVGGLGTKATRQPDFPTTP